MNAPVLRQLEGHPGAVRLVVGRDIVASETSAAGFLDGRVTLTRRSGGAPVSTTGALVGVDAAERAIVLVAGPAGTCTLAAFSLDGAPPKPLGAVQLPSPPPTKLASAVLSGAPATAVLLMAWHGEHKLWLAGVNLTGKVTFERTLSASDGNYAVSWLVSDPAQADVAYVLPPSADVPEKLSPITLNRMDPTTGKLRWSVPLDQRLSGSFGDGALAFDSSGDLYVFHDLHFEKRSGRDGSLLGSIRGYGNECWALAVARDGSGLVSLDRVTPRLSEPRCTLRWNPFQPGADKVELKDDADCENTGLALVEGIVLIAR